MKKWIIVLVAVFGFGGCGNRLYVHPTKTVQDLERDKYECRKEFPVYATNMGFAPVIHVTTSGMDECLRAHGWTPQGEQEANPTTESQYQ